MRYLLRAVAALAAVLLTVFLVANYHKPQAVQFGYPGVGMEQYGTSNDLDDILAANQVPAPLPPASQDGQLSADAYQNVQVLGHISTGEMTRLMTAMSLWVAGDQGCAYCHAPLRDEQGNIVKDEDGYVIADPNKLWSDELYTKRVSRRMLQMTMNINSGWTQHVQQTGVTCYTCHRGQAVPANIWFNQDLDPYAGRSMGLRAGQNVASPVSALASLPGDPLTPFLVEDQEIRVQSTEALPSGNRASIKQTEWTYGLMMHFSKSLGVNCTYCHNSRAWGLWDESPAVRGTAWYGIRMVRQINNEYLIPLKPEWPANRLGPLGDPPKAACSTCHAGAYKPLLGVSMLKDYPVLARSVDQPQVFIDVELTGEPVARVFFDSGVYTLKEDAPAAFEELKKALETAPPEARVIISGFHDPTGDPMANQVLARQRAKVTRDALITAGVDATRLVLRRPASTTGDGTNEEARRVELYLGQ